MLGSRMFLAMSIGCCLLGTHVQFVVANGPDEGSGVAQEQEVAVSGEGGAYGEAVFDAGRGPSLVNYSARRGLMTNQCGPIDLVFVLDSSGSMEDEWYLIRPDLIRLIDELEVQAAGDVRLGLVDFDSVITVAHSLTTDINAVKATIQNLNVWGGTAPGEPSDEAVREVVSESICNVIGDFNTPFRPIDNRVIILITDAEPLGCDDVYTPGYDDVNAQLRAQEAAALGIRIFSAFSPGNSAAHPSAEAIARQYAEVTSGFFVRTNSYCGGLFESLESFLIAGDCNGNGVRDCDDAQLPDCNNNGIMDCREIAWKTSEDCSDDGIPDECQSNCDCAGWVTIAGPSSTVEAMTVLDGDLVLGGWFSSAAGVPNTRYVARWNGTQWSSFGTGMNFYVYALTTWDPDGQGPASPQLIAGGIFSTAGGVAARAIARWNGSAWAPLGSGMDLAVLDLAVWDPDGVGPGTAQLVAAGSFTTAGGVPARGIARWDGSSWSAFGAGLVAVRDLKTWDPDGAGPTPEWLIAVASDNAYRWDPSSAIWIPLSSTSFSGGLRAATFWDSDAAGPRSEEIVLGGGAGNIPEDFYARVGRWDVQTLLPLGRYMDADPISLCVQDLQTEGGRPSRLVAGGDFTYAAPSGANRIAFWDGVVWRPLGTGFNDRVNCVGEWDPDKDGPLPKRLVAGGKFSTAGGAPSSFFAIWSRRVPAQITASPNAVLASVGGSATFSAAGIGDPVPNYQWLKNGQPIQNGPSAGGGTIAGAQTAQLAITNLGRLDTGSYALQVSNGCAQDTSGPAPLHVICLGDANCSGNIDFFDIDVFVAKFGCPSADPGCSSPCPWQNCDVDGNGHVDFFDIDPFIGLLGTTCQ